MALDCSLLSFSSQPQLLPEYGSVLPVYMWIPQSALSNSVGPKKQVSLGLFLGPGMGALEGGQGQMLLLGTSS